MLPKVTTVYFPNCIKRCQLYCAYKKDNPICKEIIGIALVKTLRENRHRNICSPRPSRGASTYLRRIRNIANLHKHGRERISTRTSARLAPTSTCGGSGILLIDLVYKFLKIYHHILLNLASPDYCKRNTKASAPRRAVALYTPRRARFCCT